MFFASKPIVRLFSVPDEKTSLSDECFYGTPVTVIEKINENWVFIETDYRYKGYVREEHIIDTDYNPNSIIIGVMTDVLDSPKISGAIITTLPAGSFIVSASETENNFRAVMLIDGTKGYVRENFIANIEITKIPDRNAVLQQAKRFLGVPYRWGGKTFSGIDCSGLCFLAYHLCGLDIFRDAKIVEGFPVKEISIKNLCIADLIFWEGHVGMYAGNKRYIHSSLKNEVVAFNSLDYRSKEYRADLAESIIAFGSVY